MTSRSRRCPGSTGASGINDCLAKIIHRGRFVLICAAKTADLFSSSILLRRRDEIPKHSPPPFISPRPKRIYFRPVFRLRQRSCTPANRPRSAMPKIVTYTARDDMYLRAVNEPNRTLRSDVSDSAGTIRFAHGHRAATNPKDKRENPAIFVTTDGRRLLARALPTQGTHLVAVRGLERRSLLLDLLTKSSDRPWIWGSYMVPKAKCRNAKDWNKNWRPF